MKRIETILTILLLGFSSALQASEKSAWLKEYNVTWTSPSENSAGSMPVGGGDIGVNVWVENGDLLLYIDRSGNIDENDQQLKSGRARGNNDFKFPARMLFPALWGPGFDWTPDHNWGGSGMIALHEMALQTSGNELRVLPAWPKDWDVDFKVHAPGKTVVECVYRDGKLQPLRVTPDSRREDVLLAE